MFRVFRIPMFMNICEYFPYLYEYVYFTYSYLGPILNILVDMLQQCFINIQYSNFFNCFENLQQ